MEIPWSGNQKERGAEDEVMGRGRRGGCLGQSCENSDLWNSLFSKNPYTGAKHERERSGESEVTSESTGCFLLGGQSSG